MKKEALADIIKYGVGFKQLIILLIRNKHSGINLFENNFIDFEGHNLPDSDDGVASNVKVKFKEKTYQSMIEDPSAPKDFAAALDEINDESPTHEQANITSLFGSNVNSLGNVPLAL